MWSTKGASSSKEVKFEEGLLQCPYDKCHQIRNERYTIHVLKCRKQYSQKLESLGLPKTGVKCRYDCGEKCFPPEIVVHEGICRLKPLFAGVEDWFDKETLEETEKLIKEERQKALKALGWRGNPTKPETPAEDVEKINGPRSIADMEWEANDAEEDWGREDNGRVFSLFKPLMDL